MGLGLQVSASARENLTQRGRVRLGRVRVRVGVRV